MALAKIAKSEFSSFRTLFQENEATFAININIQVSIGCTKTHHNFANFIELVNIINERSYSVRNAATFQSFMDTIRFRTSTRFLFSDRFHQKCLKLTKHVHLLSMFGSKGAFSGSRTAFTLRSQRSRF